MKTRVITEEAYWEAVNKCDLDFGEFWTWLINDSPQAVIEITTHEQVSA